MMPTKTRRNSTGPGATEVGPIVVREISRTANDAVSGLLDLPRVVLLDSAGLDSQMSRYSYVTADPFVILTSRDRRVRLRTMSSDVSFVADPFSVLSHLMSLFQTCPARGLPPFHGGAVGYFGYDLGRLLERVPAHNPTDECLPDLDIGFYDWVIVTDHLSGKSSLVVHDVPGWSPVAPEARIADVERRLHSVPPAIAQAESESVPIFRSQMRKIDYINAVSRAQSHILAGDIYQICLSHRLEAAWQGHPWPLYQRLRASSPVPYGAYLALDGITIMSASPERFLRLDGRQVETRPIKGTRPRGDTAERDRALAGELLASAKDQAENLMIVDLLRNDLGKVCRPGSIQVPTLAGLEGYASVWHLVSTVTGELCPQTDAADLLRACFPGGSVTGCPKIRAMEIIEELEPVRRGVYCGAIGYLSFDGGMDTSIVIRTLLYRNGQLQLQVGGAITSDSDPEAEYAETLAKGAAVLRGIGAEVEMW
jgi:para-aminobenzoate synthetase component I